MSGCQPIKVYCPVCKTDEGHFNPCNPQYTSPPMKLPSCKHGLVDHCAACDYTQSIKKEIEEQNVSPMVKQMQVLEERINKLECFQDRNCVENLAGILKLEHNVNAMMNTALEERIEKLEQTKLMYKSHMIDDLYERVKKLESAKSEGKKPHCCPICNGNKISSEITKSTLKLHENLNCKRLNPHSSWNMCMTCKGAFYHEYEDCITCKGTGIVWG